MKRRLLPFVLAGALTAAFAAPASAATCEVSGGGGAAALVSLVNANVSNVGVQICEVDVDILNNSLNNLLQNADVHVLENILNNNRVLNNSPILSGNDIDVHVDVSNNDILIGILSQQGTVDFLRITGV